MSSKAIIHQAKLNEWASRFADQKASGLTVTEWCQTHNVTRYTFFYWKRQLKDELVTKALPEIVPLAMPSVPISEPDHLPSTLDSISASCTTFQTPSVRIYINGITIELDSSVPESLIRNVIKAVRHV